MDERFEISLKNCAFFGYHGVLSEEQNMGQRFYVDVRVTMTKPTNIEDDALSASVDYGEIFKIVAHEVEQERYNLIETLAHMIGKKLCGRFDQIRSAIITVRKPSAPVNGLFECAEVVVETRN